MSKIKFANLIHPIDRFPHWRMYKIYYECDKIYLGQTKRDVMVQLGERKINDKNYDIKCFCIDSHCWSNIHNFYFSEASIIQIQNFGQLILYGRIPITLINDIPFTPNFSKVFLHFFNSLSSLYPFSLFYLSSSLITKHFSLFASSYSSPLQIFPYAARYVAHV